MSQVQEIKDRLNIIDVIGEKVSLQKSGKNYRGLCPFHSEKTPSFFVSDELQAYKCFGCGKQGDVFTFLQEYDRLTFREALEVLAKRAGIELEETTHDPQEKMRQRILEALELAAKFYRYLLTEHEAGQAGRDYLEKRGVKSKISQLFQLGFAPAGWEQLTTYLIKKKKFTPEELVAAGLAIQGKRNSLYDRFRNRLIFPLHDHRGRIVGFSGRSLDPEAKTAKYINSPETLVYHKRYLLYGYQQNLDSIREEEAVIITEGEFDMISSVQAHVKNVVAIKGSALTKDQVRILARTVNTIYLALDADAAGVEATKRAIEEIQGFEVTLRVIPLHGGKDPDDLARTDPKKWRETINNHQAAFDYVLDHARQQHDLQTAKGQRQIADEMLELVLRIQHPIERNFYLKKLAEALNQSQHVLEEQLQRLQQKQQVRGLRPVSRSVDNGSESSAPPLDQTDKLGFYLWQLALQSGQPTVRLKQLAQLHSESTLLQRLHQHLNKFFEKNEQFEIKQFARILPAELQEVLPQLYLQQLPLAEEHLQQEWEKTWQSAQARSLKNQQNKITKQLQELETKNKLTDQEKKTYEELQNHFTNLTQALQNVRNKV